MDLLESFILDLYEFLLNARNISALSTNIIRKHTRKLSKLGEISFPLKIGCWNQLLLKKEVLKIPNYTILDYNFGNIPLEMQLKQIQLASKNWPLLIHKIEVQNDEVCVYLNRQLAFAKCINQILKEEYQYGAVNKIFPNKICLELDNEIEHNDLSKMNLSELRATIVQKVTNNILDYLTIDCTVTEFTKKLTLRSNEKNENTIVCGSVVNEKGLKNTDTNGEELYKKRALDVQLLAQHRYGLRSELEMKDVMSYVPKGSVTLELLENKLHKSVKILLNNPLYSNKGPAFIFYNCARLSKLLEVFNNKRQEGIYKDFPNVQELDFSNLKREEEWEILYVYLIQFPSVIKNCVNDIGNGKINIHYLVTFLGNLSITFSSYYRSVPILQVCPIKCDNELATLNVTLLD